MSKTNRLLKDISLELATLNENMSDLATALTSVAAALNDNNVTAEELLEIEYRRDLK